MIVLGSALTLAFFLLVGWLVSKDMIQQRNWRRRAAEGDHAIAVALIEEAMASWRAARSPRHVPASIWAGVQRAELAAAGAAFAVVQSSSEGEFRTVDGRREQVASALDEAFALAAKLVEMMLYDVPNLALGSVRVDVYSTFAADGGAIRQQPILTTTALRAAAEGLDWEESPPATILARFQTAWAPDAEGRPLPIDLPPIPAPPAGDDRRAS